MSFLSKIYATQLIKGRQRVESIGVDQSVGSAVKKMEELKVLSLPVANPLKRSRDDRVEAFVGMISMWDIVRAVWFRVNEHEGKEPIDEGRAAEKLYRQRFHCRKPEEIEEEKAVNRVLEGSVKDLLEVLSQMSVFSPLSFVFPAQSTVEHLLEAFSGERPLHRLLLCDHGDYFICSQSDAVRILVEATDVENRTSTTRVVMVPLMSQTVAQAGMTRPGHGSVFKIHPHQPTVNALQLMSEHEVQAVAVVDDSDVLLGTFSASDLRGLDAQTIVSSLWLPAKDFLKLGASAAPQLTCSPEDTILSVAIKMLQNKVHRLWVCDEHKKVVSVVTLTDVLTHANKLTDIPAPVHASDGMKPTCEPAFLKVRVGSLITKSRRLMFVSADDTVETALTRMGAARVLSLPVNNAVARVPRSGTGPQPRTPEARADETFIGFLSLFDIVHSIWFRVQEQHEGKPPISEIAAGRLWRQKYSARQPAEIATEKAVERVVNGTVKELLQLGTDTSLFSPVALTYPEDVSLDHVIDSFAAHRGIHRVLVKHSTGHSVLSQADVVRVLWGFANEEKKLQTAGPTKDYCDALDCFSFRPCPTHSPKAVLLPVLNQTIEQLGLSTLANSTVYSITPEEPTITAFKMMSEHSVHAVAVITKEGELVGTFSSSDLRGLNGNTIVQSLWLPARQFLKLGPQVTCTPKDTLWSVVEKLTQRKIHRVWVRDDHKVVSVVTLTDVIHRCRVLANR